MYALIGEDNMKAILLDIILSIIAGISLFLFITGKSNIAILAVLVLLWYEIKHIE